MKMYKIWWYKIYRGYKATRSKSISKGSVFGLYIFVICQKLQKEILNGFAFVVCILDNLANERANLAYMRTAWQKADRARLSDLRATRTFFASYTAIASNTIADVRCRTRKGLHRDRKPSPHTMSSRTPSVPPMTASSPPGRLMMKQSATWGRSHPSASRRHLQRAEGSTKNWRRDLWGKRENRRRLYALEGKSRGKTIASVREEKKSWPGPLWLIVNSIMQNL
jgi:hypothetical protein